MSGFSVQIHSIDGETDPLKKNTSFSSDLTYSIKVSLLSFFSFFLSCSVPFSSSLPPFFHFFLLFFPASFLVLKTNCFLWNDDIVYILVWSTFSIRFVLFKSLCFSKLSWEMSPRISFWNFAGLWNCKIWNPMFLPCLQVRKPSVLQV